MSERWIHVTARLRGAPRLDDVELDAIPDDPTIDALALLKAGAQRIVIAGGEPSLRADLPALARALPGATLRTDGLALVSAAAIKPLRDAGLAAVRVLLHSAQPVAHDWMIGVPGAAKRAMRALLVAADVGLRIEIEAVVTRSNAPVLPELVELAERLGVRAVHLRRLEHRGAATREALTVRFGLLEAPFEAAQVAAARGRVALVAHGYPRCALSTLGAVLAPADAIEHVFVDAPGWAEVAALHASPASVRCAGCPSICPGAPAAYVERFGSGELSPVIG